MTRIIRAADRDTKTQPAANFVGTVYADEVVVGEAPSRMRATRVTFTPGARTNWHSHPVGQVLFCLTGLGYLTVASLRRLPARRSAASLLPPAQRREFVT